MRQFLWPFRSSKCITVEPQFVNHHPKCEYLVFAYGRWSLTRIELQGASCEKMSRRSMLSTIRIQDSFGFWIQVLDSSLYQ